MKILIKKMPYKKAFSEGLKNAARAIICIKFNR